MPYQPLQAFPGVFTDVMLRRCEEIMTEICDDFGTEPVEFNGEDNHVHPLVRYPPKPRLGSLGMVLTTRR